MTISLKAHSTLMGIVAILLWGSLATLGSFLLHLPPFYILGISFIIGSIPSWFKFRSMFPGLKIFLWGLAGYFCYHFFLFYAFRFAPAIEANLINYMWPVIMVLMTPLFFRNQKLKWYNLVGCLLAVVGCALLVGGELGKESLGEDTLQGYFYAFLAALSWPLYSLGKKKLGSSSVWSVGGFCLSAGILCLLTHSLIEPRVVLQLEDAKWILVMGLGPFGLAFYCWDIAMSEGNSKIIGALAYLTPVISTLGLIIFGGQKLIFTTGIAMVLIIGGASTGILDFLPSKRLLK